MDALHITDQARALMDKHGDGAEDYAQHHLDAARAVNLAGATRDWQAVLEAIHQLRGHAPG